MMNQKNSKYDPLHIQKWFNQNITTPEVNLSTHKKKFYCLTMFPYPSGHLHMGHVRVYSICDTITRVKKMQGYEVFHPMGWDAFGLPAENAALKHGLHPSEWTQKNIAHMKQQLESLGCNYDWNHELQTCDASYYKWQQWLFLQMHKNNLAYRLSSVVNWDPVDQTVLANEQVIDGKGWRSGAVVERKAIPQWFVRITDYADALLDDLHQLKERWPEQVLTMQNNWIGRSKGAVISFTCRDDSKAINDNIHVYTTRPDTLFGVAAIMIAADHPLAKKIAINNPKISDYIAECLQGQTAESALETMKKTGLNTGLHAKHPLSNTLVPVWIANYILGHYGQGAVMSVPAHDKRDYEFALEYKLPIKQVITGPQDSLPYLDHGTLIESDEYSGMTSSQAIDAIIAKLADVNAGYSEKQYRLRDWGISRQRYWGCPIPIIYCKSCGIVPVPEDQLPVLLPIDIDYKPGETTLANIDSFKKCTCPNCHNLAERETDTFDTFFDSSWYFIRYLDSQNSNEICRSDFQSWLPVDLYIGGIEHAILHLLYARFMTKVMADLKLVKHVEPFKQLLTQGMVLNKGMKMSKSKGNIVDPAQIISQYGSDAVRLFMIFAAPPEQSLEWNDHGIEGAYKFLSKLFHLCQEHTSTDLRMTAEQDDINNSLYQDAQHILNSLLRDYEKQHLNTVVSSIMKLVNLIDDKSPQRIVLLILKDALSCLYPICPKISHYLWHQLGGKTELLTAKWPQVNHQALAKRSINYVVQVNGKTKFSHQFSQDDSETDILQFLIQSERMNKWLDGKTYRTIFVPKRLVNFVCK